jgi:processive 1,2-diacylglycerol beta-glucosyltransferase
MKILLISVSAGAGHVRAAEAVKKTIDKFYPDIQAEHVDMMDFVSPAFKASITKIYDALVKQIPSLWGFLYKKTSSQIISKQLKKAANLLKKMQTEKLFEYITQQNPDYILCTHFLPADYIDQSEELSKKYKSGVLLTDYDMHTLWMSAGNHDYFVATEKMKWKLAKSGIPEEKIYATGIPIDPVFYENKNKNDLRTKYGIDLNNKMLLVLSGGQGMIHIDSIIKILMKENSPLTIVGIAGSNKSLLRDLEEIKAPQHIDYRPVGWTKDIDEYIRMSDIVISKSGGLTTTECFILQKPIIIMDPIPGQEEHNAHFLMEHGLGVIANGAEDILYYSKNNSFFKPNKNAPDISSAKKIINLILQQNSNK